MSLDKRWLSLSDVAELLGVHPSTVRNWADQGRIPMQRTQGGHRRFDRSQIELWIKSQRVDSTEHAEQLVQSALGNMRFHINEAHLEAEAWYGKLDKKARDGYRRGGRNLMQGLIRYLASDAEEGKSEAHSVGYHYATIGRRSGLSASEATQAFLFFRSALIEAMLNAYEEAAVQSPQAWRGMLRQINAFTDQVMLRLMQTYEAFEAGVA
ncbi:MAG: helix-turn-helix domain-containing protein [Chloroflexi bacterium]|nr:MAG: helix-turn-helix domain-containing protein [Chloroflexota bacterium]MBL1194246.1 helix-turn-helix domain-containing protein [Chloroflexota bacterium]NOH11539.1 helix-turn-helix domain-containing protein [Chloroflexota bacterium]